MLSKIRLFWPPGQVTHAEIGHMQRMMHTTKGRLVCSMDGLHDPAWWTGLRIAILSKSETFDVSLKKRDGSLAFPNGCRWIQESNEWIVFPWPIPAKMATEMGVYVEIQTLHPTEVEQSLTVRIMFQELSRMSVFDKYLFVDKDKPLHYWNGRRKAWGNEEEGAEPIWRTLHTVVPKMEQLISDSWDDTPFCIHSWDEKLHI